MREQNSRKESRRTGNIPVPGGLRRRAYRRAFRGYTEVKRIGPDGKAFVERVYTGHYFEPVLTRKQRVRLRVCYGTLFTVGAGVYFWSATRPVLCNTALYVGVFQALALLAALWCLYVLLFYIPAMGKLTVGEYDSLHRPLIRSALACTLCQEASAAAALVCCFRNRDAAAPADLLCAGAFALSGALFAVIRLLESRVEYAVLENEAARPESGSESAP